jgi:hypothetical protein
MNAITRTAFQIVAPRVIAAATLLAVGYAAHKYEMKKLNEEYRELCETTKK